MTKILTIAGSDIFSGGGLQADLATITQLGAKGFAALTSITAVVDGDFQVQPLTPLQFQQQLNSLSSLGFAAIKIGLIPSQAHYQVLVDWLPSQAGVPIVLDPVFALKEKRDQISESWLPVIKKIAPFCQLLTPNLKEAELLLGRSIEDRHQMEQAAQELSQQLDLAVYLKGGARLEETKAFDYLETLEGGLWLEADKTKGLVSGSGCVLATSLATKLGLGLDLFTASQSAKKFVTKAILMADEWGVSPYAVH